MQQITSTLFFLLLSSLLHISQSFKPPTGVCLSCFSPPTTSQSTNFGRLFSNAPSAIFTPTSSGDVSLLLTVLSNSSVYNNITVGPNGARHSTSGNEQVAGGIVVEMKGLPRSIKVDPSNRFVDADGGSLWVEVLEESLQYGLSPRSWTDYLFLTVGGTLSVGGISGQAFKYGPQIMNVLEMDVVTGTGEMVTCSRKANRDLFFGVLGGLGQFGIIMRARIALQVAPQRAKWIKIPYKSFAKFTTDQQFLINMNEVDYVEGEIISTGGKITYEIELALYYNKGDPIEKKLDGILWKLGQSKKVENMVDLSYFDFLNRVRKEEQSLRKEGQWEVPHPWLNVFVPRCQIFKFHDLLIRTIASNPVNGPLLVYPFFANKWDPRMSTMLPGKSKNTVIFLVGILRSAAASCKVGTQCMKRLINLNSKIVDGSVGPGSRGAKLYLAPWKGEEEWSAHFGEKWEGMKQLKNKYDPLHILAPGPKMFQRIPVPP